MLVDICFADILIYDRWICDTVAGYDNKYVPKAKRTS
jgi:hypothetical protein